MEVILNQDIDRLGKTGSVVKVKAGFARNFLIPKGLAQPSTPESLKKIKQQKEAKTLQMAKIKQKCEDLKTKLAGISLTIPVLTHGEDELYAQITAQDVAVALKEEGFDLHQDLIILDEPIKSLGIYQVPLKLHPEVTSNIKVWVVKK